MPKTVKKKFVAKPKRSSKPHGHYCRSCGRCRANEKFSGKGHAAHICRECASEKRAERKREQEIQAFGPAYLANRKRIAVELNYDNWCFHPWKEDFNESAFEMQFDDDGIYDVDWGIDKYDSYLPGDTDVVNDNAFNGDWNALIESSVGADRGTLRRYQSYLETARILAELLAPFPEVQKIILFGDFAKPPYREVNPKQTEQPGSFHLPNDLDLGIWLSSTENLHHMRRL